MIICQLCNKELKGLQGLSNHLHLSHNDFDKKLYYDTYMKQSDEGICKKCSKPTHFRALNYGYAEYCCRSCQISAQNNGGNPIVRAKMQQTILDRYGVKEPFEQQWVIDKSHNQICNMKRSHSIQEKLTLFEHENDCIQISKVGRYKCDKLGIPTISYLNRKFIKRQYLSIVENYKNNPHRNRRSKQEKYIIKQLKLYDKQLFIIYNDRKQIYPYEIDIFIPKFNIGIEFNGIWTHSIENNPNKEYHLMKSLLCREKGIRLIHIYEFENLDQQINLVIDLLNGTDNFNENDFNKNNFIEIIPKPEIIYQDKYTIYGAGKLF